MESIFAELWTPEMQSVFNILVLFMAALYVLSIAWVVKDSYMRGRYWFVWGIVSLIPFLGVIAYILLRPSMYSLDKNEQELEIAFKTRELEKYGNCGNCGFPVQSDYVMCPSCNQKLKNLCLCCNKALDQRWTICPYCTTAVGSSGVAASAGIPRRGTSRFGAQSSQPRVPATGESASTKASSLGAKGDTSSKDSSSVLKSDSAKDR